MSKLNKSVDDLGMIIAVISFSMMSFLLISLVNIFFDRYANDSQTALITKLFFYALAVALSYTFAKIHRSGVTEIVAFKNVWHLIVVIMIVYTTLQIENKSIANTVTYIKSHVLKNTETYKNDDTYKSAESKRRTAENALKFWQNYKGTEAERLMIKQYKSKYELALKEKNFRLKNYKYATTKKADRQIAEALKNIKKIEDKILQRREAKIAYYTKLQDEAIAQKRSYKKQFESKQKEEILQFSKDAKHWAKIIVTIMAAVYSIHGLLLITSKDGFTLRGLFYNMFPTLENRHKDIEAEPAATLKNEPENKNIIKFEPEKRKVGHETRIKDAKAHGKLAAALNSGDRVTKKQFAEIVGVKETAALSMMFRFVESGVLRKVDNKYYYNPPTLSEEAV